jgi:hypothetical protein
VLLMLVQFLRLQVYSTGDLLPTAHVASISHMHPVANPYMWLL